MRALGELCLLSAFVGSGFAAFACALGWHRQHRGLRATGAGAAVCSVVGLTAVMLVLAWALFQKDYRYAYVSQYSSELLPWYYSLSALWVGQAGSLLLWAWFCGLLALVYAWWPWRQPSRLREPSFAVLMGYVCFLVAIMVFAADPMEPSVSMPRDGVGLSPLLQHPSMLIHPPIVFLGYALWTVPFALVTVALASGRLDASWVRQARPWALAAWIVLGAGILLGAEWAYEELGWGGYWAWDPVENGSLIPWLTGTALIHAMMVWQYRGGMKKTAIALAIATFGLCNFATFLTRSGIFSSLHAFSKSPIGWLFLVFMGVLAVGAAVMIVGRRKSLVADQPIGSAMSREACIWISTVALLLLATVTLGGTISAALSNLIVGRPIMMGTGFYNSVLIPTGLVLLATTAAAPLLRWGRPPTNGQMKSLVVTSIIATCATAVVGLAEKRHPIELAVLWLSVAAVLALLASLLFDARRRSRGNVVNGLLRTLRDTRRQYAGFLIHMGFVCLALGVTGSSLGSRQREVFLSQGESVDWAGHRIRLASIHQRAAPDKLIGEAELEISRGGHAVATLRPAQHFHIHQQQWTTEVAIHSDWSGDLYTILHTGDNQGRARLTLVQNPMMRWLWVGGWIMGVGALARLWPAKSRLGGSAVLGPVVRSSQDTRDRRGLAAASLLVSAACQIVVGRSPWL